MDKLVASPAAAVADIKNGASVGIAGFGVAHRFPNGLIIALRDQGSAGPGRRERTRRRHHARSPAAQPARADRRPAGQR